MVLTRPGDDPTPRAGEGGPRRTAAQLATDPAFTGAYATIGQARANASVKPRTPRLKTGGVTYLSTFQSGHGWSVTAGGGVTTPNDTTNYVLGSQCASGTTSGAGGACVIRKDAFTAVDLTANLIVALVKLSDPTRTNQVLLYAGSGGMTSFFTIPAGNGGTVGVSAFRASSEWTWLVFDAGVVQSTTGTPSKSAITDFQFYVQDKSGGAITISVNAIGYVPKPAVYPNGVVTFTWDDVYPSQYTVARPYLDKYGFGANAFVIVDKVGAAGGMTQAQLDELERYHGWEIGGHAYTTANHNAGFSTLSTSALDDECYNLKNWLLTNGYRGADLFAYPLGDDGGSVPTTVGHYFSFGRHVVATPTQTQIVDNPMRVRTMTGFGNSLAASTITGIVDRAYSEGEWLIIYGHDLTSSVTTPSTQYTTASFQTVVDYVAAKGIPVRTVGEVLAAVNAKP